MITVLHIVDSQHNKYYITIILIVKDNSSNIA